MDGKEEGATWGPASDLKGLVEKVGTQELLHIGLRIKYLDPLFYVS